MKPLGEADEVSSSPLPPRIVNEAQPPAASGSEQSLPAPLSPPLVRKVACQRSQVLVSEVIASTVAVRAARPSSILARLVICVVVVE